MADLGEQDDWRSGFGLYVNTQPEAAQDRAAHLAQVVRLSPLLMLANVVCGTLVVLARDGRVDWQSVLWLAVLMAGAVVGLQAWWAGRRSSRDRASVQALGQATLHAAWMGACWGVAAALWFPGLSGPSQVVIATIVTGMLGAGGVALSPLPRASMAYVVCMTVGALVALWRTGNSAYALVAVALCCYAVVVIWTAWGVYSRQRLLRLAQREGERQSEWVSLLLKEFEDNASDALWETDASGRLVRRSARLEALLGVRGDALDEVRWPEWFLGAQGGVAVVRAWRESSPFRAAKLHWRRGEVSQWWQLSGRPIRDADANVIGWRGVIADITEAQRYEDQLREQADHDLLTGLPNRGRLLAAIEQAAQRGLRGWLLSIDLDHFKLINDTSGHSVGDEVLREIGHRISACVGEDDLAARLGGDEFALLRLSGNPDAPPLGLANTLIRSLSQPVKLGVKQLHVGASIGLAPVRGREENAEELLVNADMALYHAKRTGRGRAEVYGPELGEANRRMNRIELELREGLDRHQLYLNFQPKVDAQRLLPVGVEALMRWQHPSMGLVSPGDFIATAERCGLIHELGEFALQEACLAVKALGGMTVAVNVSPVQLMSGDFEATLRDVLLRTGVAAHFLELEVTESVMLDDARGALERLHALKRLGVRVALDDFGTGYSSLSYLRSFPFDTLKIDRSFVRGLSERGTRTIVHSMLQMAQGLGMKTVVEGVETPEQLHAVQELGCDEVQGFLVARPMPLPQVVAWRNGQRSDLIGDSVDSRIPAWWHSTAPAGFLDGR